MALDTLDTLHSVVALAGGVGGAKLADGLARILPPGALTVIVNTGDDFRHYGLAISPDLDTVMYTLGAVASVANGWGLEGDTQQMLSMMRRYGDDAWFGLGDKDVATHLLRTQWLAEGSTLTQVTERLSKALGIRSCLLPMSDDSAPTLVDTVEYGVISFQEYFVRYRWQPTVKRILIERHARSTERAASALQNADLIVICPSNPMLSIEPILKVDGYRDLIKNRRVPCVVVSPLIGGQAVKGPAAKLMKEMGMEVSSNGVARYYEGLIDGIVVDKSDDIQNGRVSKTDILMHGAEDRARLAKEVLEWVISWHP